MAAGSMQAFLRGVVLSEQNPLLRFVRKPVVRQMVERASKKRPMGTQTYNFLWALAMTAGWVQQQEAFALDRRQSAFGLVSDGGGNDFEMRKAERRNLNTALRRRVKCKFEIGGVRF